MRRVALAFFLALPIGGATVQLLQPLPQGAVSKAIQIDASGSIYVAGSLSRQSAAFVAKLTADGSTLLYLTALDGSSEAAALAIAPDGSAYVAGGRLLARLDPDGHIAYTTQIPGITNLTGIAINTAGEILVTGSDTTGSGFTLKYDATLSNLLLSIDGYGGGLIALDLSGNVYLAGVAFAGSPGQDLPPLSSNAFQSTHDARLCFVTACPFQYVAKFDPSGTQLLWATYVTGAYGATPAAVAIDAASNVILAGTTNSDDYPITAGAFQTAYSPSAPRLPSGIFTPEATGYVTRLNADGTGLLWSTYFGGSNIDNVTGMAISASGDIYLSGHASSSDLPGLSSTPPPCRPQPNQVLGFVAHLAADGATIAATQLIYDAPACLYTSCIATISDFSGWPIALRSDATLIAGGVNGQIAAIDFSTPARLACIQDAADRTQLAAVTPGQIISVFGSDLAPPAPFKNPASIMPSTDTFGVFFNGIPAPILYASGNQINAQVPYEIDGQSSVQMKVVNNNVSLHVSETRDVNVVARRPSIFLADPVVESPIPGTSVCGTMLMPGIAPVAVNQDGTLNDCSNPALAGSTVTFFVNGLGVVTPAQPTGTIASSPAVPLTPGIDGAIATTTTPGSITGVAQVQVQLPSITSGAVTTVGPSFAGSPLPEQPLIIWTRQNN